MITTFNRTSVALAVSAALGLVSGAAHAQIVINDTLTGGHSSFNWLALDGACLTAGDNSVTPYDSTQPAGYTPSPSALTIPRCTGLAYYTNKGSTLVGGANGTMPDASGAGALRLTNGDKRSGGSNGDYQTGAVISNFTFPMSAGVQVTWTSVTYGGDNNNNTGADGISFFLSDGAYTPIKAGGSGGSLGYSCSNGNPQYEGLIGGYIGVGIDEYGNFTNGATFDAAGNLSTTGDNTATGTGYHPGTIGIRGAGNITWAQLNSAYPAYYPGTATGAQQTTAVRQTCATGHLYNTLAGTANTTNATKILDYPLLASSAFVGSISNQQATSTTADNVPTRAAAVPITYALRITSTGKLDFSYSVNGGASTTVATGMDIVSTNGTLPASLRFGFSAGTGGSNNVHEITCFKAAPADNSNSTAGSNVQSGKVQTGSQFFIAYYHPTNWWGQMTANALVYDGTTLSAATNATWDASCKLTGGVCASMSGSPTVTAQTSRVILSNSGATSTGGAGVAFTTSGLSSTQLGYLAGSSTTAPVLDYLRGSRTNEAGGTGTGAYRVRSGVLGDIVDSSPVLVSYPNSAYTSTFTDKLGTSANASMPEGTTYATFKANNYTRRNVVYVGANDGMMHGFSAGKFNAPSGTNSPAFDTASTWNDGTELLAYVPAQVVATIQPTTSCAVTDLTCRAAAAALEFSNPGYYHNFFVDSTPGTGDLYYGTSSTKAWHTWLVGGLGAGGHIGGAIQNNTTTLAQPVSAFYVLDVTNPTNFTEGNASSLVVGEWNSSTLTCTVGTSDCGKYLGQTLGTPVIRRLHDGSWGVIFGNGTNSYGSGTAATQGRSGLFIMHVPAAGSSTTAFTFQYIDANAGPNGGIVQVAAADLDGDHVTDYVYAGDVLGNLYRFDLTNTDPSNWKSMKIFTTAGSQQPITTTPFVTSVPGAGSGNPKIVVAFGTGQKLPATTNHAEVFATGQQNVYGIWDANMTAWNSLSSDTKFAALTQSPSTSPVTVDPTAIQEQTVSVNADGTRAVTNIDMCWVGMSSCSGSTTNAMGWKLKLPTSTEQVIFNPIVFNDDLFFNTTIPATSTVITCESNPVSGWTMGISLSNGGAGDSTAFADGSSGHNTNGTGSPSQLTGDGSSTGNGPKPFVCENTNNNHTVNCDEIHPLTGAGKRVTWTKVR